MARDQTEQPLFRGQRVNVLYETLLVLKAAEIACVKKHNKYKSLKSANFIFKALAFETLGPWCKEASSFIDNVGSKLIAESGDLKANYVLRQRISLAIQPGNAASIRGALPETTPLEEIYFS
jgi:hypothetical protein